MKCKTQNLMKTGTAILISAGIGASVAAIAVAALQDGSDIEVVQIGDVVTALNPTESHDHLLREVADQFRFDTGGILPLDPAEKTEEPVHPIAQPQTLMELLEIEHAPEYKQGGHLRPFICGSFNSKARRLPKCLGLFHA